MIPTRKAITLTLFLCIGLSQAGSAQPRSTMNVLMMHWSSEDLPSSPAMDAAIREGVSRSGLSVEYFAEYLESDRFPQEAASLALRDYMRTKYDGLRIDVVLAQSIPALQFVLDHRGTLFPDAPIVFAGVAVPRSIGAGARPGITGVVCSSGFRETLALALRLHPATERVFVIAESPGSPLRDIVRSELRDFESQVTLSFIAEDSVARTVAAVKAVPPRSLILFVRHPPEPSGHIPRPPEVAHLVADASPVPVYGITDEVLGSGVTGGNVYEIRAVGARMGEIAARLLRGTRVEEIPIEQARYVPTFDWRQLQRWNIPESRLPQGSVILFRPQSFLEMHPNWAAGGLLVFMAQFALIGSLLVQMARRRRAEQETRNSEQRYRSVVDTQSDLVCRFLPDSTLTFVNDAYCRFWNKRRDELLGLRFVELIPVPSRKAVLERIGRLQTGMDSHEHQVTLPDGSIGWHHWVNQAILDERGQIVELQGVGRDVTDRKRAEEALGQLEARNRAIVGAIPDLMFLLTREGVYLDYYAPDTSRLLLEPSQFLGRHMRDVLPPGLAAAFADCFARLASGETPVMLEYTLPMADGDRYYETRMVPCVESQVLAVVRDITERKRAEHDARRNAGRPRPRVTPHRARRVRRVDRPRGAPAADEHHDQRKGLPAMAREWHARPVGDQVGAHRCRRRRATRRRRDQPQSEAVQRSDGAESPARFQRGRPRDDGPRPAASTGQPRDAHDVVDRRAAPGVCRPRGIAAGVAEPHLQQYRRDGKHRLGRETDLDLRVTRSGGPPESRRQRHRDRTRRRRHAAHVRALLHHETARDGRGAVGQSRHHRSAWRRAVGRAERRGRSHLLLHDSGVLDGRRRLPNNPVVSAGS